MAGPADLANNTIHDVQRELGTEGGSKQAAQVLMKEIDDERKLVSEGKMTQADFDLYVKTVMTGLKQELPALSVGWVANKSTEPLFTKQGMYGEGTLINKEQFGAIVINNPNTPEGVLAKSFLDQMSVIDGRNTFNEKDSEVSIEEVNQFITDHKNEVPNLAYAKLFSTDSGKILLDQLDTRGKGIFSNWVNDDNFDRDNLWQFINDAKNGGDNAGTVRALAVESGMTESQVLDTLQRMYDNWNTPQFKLMQENGVMNAASIAKGAGFSSLEACAQAAACNVPEAIVPPSITANSINAQDTTKPPKTSEVSSIAFNSDGQAVRVDYKTGFPLKIQRDPLSKAPINFATGDGYTLAYDAVSKQWTESHVNPATGLADVFAITAPTFSEETGQLDYAYTGPNAAKIQYRPDGGRVKTDATGTAEVVAPADATATSQLATLGGSYDTKAMSFGDAATALAMKKNNNALSDNPTDRRRQIQEAKVDLLIKGYEQNVLKGTAPAGDPVVKALNELRTGSGIGEFVYADGKKISIYQMLRGTISY